MALVRVRNQSGDALLEESLDTVVRMYWDAWQDTELPDDAIIEAVPEE